MAATKLNLGFVRRRADYILEQARQSAPPIDLAAVARIQSVRAIELRPMMVDGCMDPIQGGFRIFIHNDRFQAVDLGEEPFIPTLKPHQRFTLAHEIVHTFFYDSSTDRPVLSKGVPKIAILESLCQRGARQLLMPEKLLVSQLNGREALTPRLTVALSKRFGTSAEVVIRRIDELESIKAPGQALILARADDSGQDAQIMAVCYHQWLLPYLTRPKPYASLKETYGKQLEADFWESEVWEQEIRRGAATVLIKKRPYSGRRRAFFLEVQLLFPR